jgi:hypothetical protein
LPWAYQSPDVVMGRPRHTISRTMTIIIGIDVFAFVALVAAAVPCQDKEKKSDPAKLPVPTNPTLQGELVKPIAAEQEL